MKPKFVVAAVIGASVGVCLSPIISLFLWPVLWRLHIDWCQYWNVLP